MKDLNICVLMDFYSSLLTGKQAEMMAEYYNEDLSLSEIAEEMDITRQGVRDAVKKAEGILRAAEDEMGFAKRFMDMAAALGKLRALTQELIENKENINEKLAQLLEEIDSLRALSGVTDYGI
ncbi:MAG: sigma factor-like helix-turn-helix DNA-binding protein [Bacillota bacterium]|nr:sigma factor-like helix-turn-helix DNA-binding protein [Bacillota bacterium]